MINIILCLSYGRKILTSYDENMIVKDFMKDVSKKYFGVEIDLKRFRFLYNFHNLLFFLRQPLGSILKEKYDNRITIFDSNDLIGCGAWYQKEINIKFIKVLKNVNKLDSQCDLLGLLKLCLLKEISYKLDESLLQKLPDIISSIIKILKNGYIADPNVKQSIKEILEK